MSLVLNSTIDSQIVAKTSAISCSQSPRTELYKNKEKCQKQLRRRRSETVVELRKQKKENICDQRRSISVLDYWSDETINDEEDEELMALNINEVLMTLTVANVSDISPKYIKYLRQFIQNSREPQNLESCEQKVEQILVVTQVMTELLSDKMVTKLIICIKSDDSSMALLQEVLSLLALICSYGKDEVIVLVKAGIVNDLLSLLKYDNFKVIDEAVSALTFIWDSCTEMQDLITNTNFLKSVTDLIDSEASVSPSKLVKNDPRISLMRTISWSLLTLCQNRNLRSYLLAHNLISYFQKLLHYFDDKVKTYVLKALSATTERIAAISDDNLSPVLKIIHSIVSNITLFESIIQLLLANDNNIVFYAIRIIGNIISWGESYTQIAIQAKILDRFNCLLNHQNSKVQREAAYTVSNISAGNYCQIQAIIDSNLMPAIVELLYMGDYRTQVEAAHVLLNITSVGSAQQIAYIINIDKKVENMDSVDAMATLLTAVDVKTINNCLKFYDNILTFAKRINILNEVIKKCEISSVVYYIEELQNNRNTDLANLATHLMDEYFSKDISLEEEMLLNTSLNSDDMISEQNFSF
ncbi:importin subunit alpha-3-like [Oppia nitens]|uniref:importin subunit alpha-3-like n=1 Tax=Oppia nitens TaxID=1686743 RepID=UPI0023DA8A8D|nr:importin subunit alpha-3-like [Oppia nitens]